ncbi:hypothetical protein RI367_001762 [Sorochytrium milnesiophthora]
MLAPPDLHFDYGLFADELDDHKRTDMMRAVNASEHLRRGLGFSLFGHTTHAPEGRPVWNSTSHLSALMYAGIAYCNNATSLLSWTCPPLCGDALVNGTRYLASLLSTKTQMSGFVAVNDAQQQIVVVFRGTLTLVNWLNDLTFFKYEYAGGRPAGFHNQSVKVHRGFWSSYDSIRANMLSSLTQALRANPTYTVMFTGHSLGAAVATLAAVDVMVKVNLPARQVKLITLGSPRVGSSAFVDMFSSLNITVDRIVEENDLVPHVPPRKFGFWHVPGEKYSMGGKIYACSGREASRVPFVSVTKHSQFMGKVFAGSCSDNLPAKRWQ